MSLRRGVMLLGLTLMLGCGDAETVLAVDVDLEEFAVTAEIDLLYLELVDADGATLGRRFELSLDETRPAIDLVRGERTRAVQTLTVAAFKGDVFVAAAPPVAVEFREGDSAPVSVVIARPAM